MMEQMAAPAASGPTVGVPAGARQTSLYYWDDAGVRRKAAEPVPVNEYGQLAGVPWRCGKCKGLYWMPLSTKPPAQAAAAKAQPQQGRAAER